MSMKKSGRPRRASQRGPRLRRGHDRLGGGGGRDHDVHQGQRRLDLIEGHRDPAEAPGQLLGPAPRAVGHVHRQRALVDQVARGELAHLPRPDQQHRLALEALEDPPRQLHRRVGDRHREPPDLGLRPHALGRAERLAHQGVEHRARGARGLGEGEGVLHLPQDLRLAQDHGVEARRDAERVQRGLVAGRGVEQRLELPPGHAAMAAEPAERLRARLARHRGHPVDLDPVARGEDHDLLQEAAAREVGEDLADLLLLEGELLAHRHRRGAVIHPRHEQEARGLGNLLLRSHGVRGGRPRRSAWPASRRTRRWRSRRPAGRASARARGRGASPRR